ncbi:MAG TPA: class I SAM-dependent methyltransferase [Puia sp.]|nr:class I SAM-dependent methyltransferase [Puia sp.]
MRNAGEINALIICLLLAASVVPIRGLTQGLLRQPGSCGLYFKNMGELKKQLGEQVQFYRFHEGERIASIGAQCANWEAAFMTLCDSVDLYLEDIDSTSLNDSQVRSAWQYYSAMANAPIRTTTHVVIGNDTTTLLPSNFFDKIIIINSFHEFNQQVRMLADIRDKLKPGGRLEIDETLARKSGELHIQCHKRIFTEEELIEIVEKTGFHYLEGLNMNFRASVPVRKIFAFEKR